MHTRSYTHTANEIEAMEWKPVFYTFFWLILFHFLGEKIWNVRTSVDTLTSVKRNKNYHKSDQCFYCAGALAHTRSLTIAETQTYTRNSDNLLGLILILCSKLKQFILFFFRCASLYPKSVDFFLLL